MKQYSYYQDLFSVVGKTAIVTGASGTGQGLGRVFAIALAKAGANVVICSRNTERLEETKAMIQAVSDVDVTALNCDVRDAKDVKNVVAVTMAKYGKIDILVNNAGIPLVKNFFDYTLEDWNLVMETNMTGMFLFTQEVGRHMKERGYGKIINLASINAHSVTRCNTVYVTSKGAIRQFTKAVACDLIKYGINVHSISPGIFIKPENIANDPDDNHKIGFAVAGQAMKRTARLEEIEGALLYLASDASSYCVGTDILVDGGITSLCYENPDLFSEVL